MSATLKTGHHCTSMKSTTAPPQEAGVAAEGPVDQVAERAADDQPERHRRPAGDVTPRLYQSRPTDDGERQQRDERPAALGRG